MFVIELDILKTIIYAMKLDSQTNIIEISKID